MFLLRPLIINNLKKMKNRYLLSLFFVFTLAANGYSQESFRITHGPWLSDMSDDGVTIIWMTSKNAVSWVELAPDDGSNFYGEERPRFYDTRYGRIQAASNLHQVRLENLQAGTRYRYAIFSKEVLNWENDSRIIYGITVANAAYARNSLSFRTFSNKDDTVSFMMFNDLHGRAQFMKDLCKNADFGSLDMVFFNGDMSTAINSEEQLLTDFVDASVDLFAKRIPVAFNRGNHETRGRYADYIFNYFPMKNGQVYRTFNVGDVAFLLLDCGEDKPDSDIEYSGLADFDAYREAQAAWLREAIREKSFAEAPVKIVILHMPPGVSNWHGTLHLDKTLLPLLNEAKVDVVFSGHTHRYSYNPPVPGKISFPVIVNSNNAYLRCDVINGKIIVKIIGTEGTKPIEHQLN